jgi:hypothetical protein
MRVGAYVILRVNAIYIYMRVSLARREFRCLVATVSYLHGGVPRKDRPGT